MAGFKTATTEIEIRDPRFPYVRGARSLVIHHNTRDGDWVSGTITGVETHLPVPTPSFRLYDDEYEKLFNFIVNTVGSGLRRFLYWDSRTPGTEGAYFVTYLGGVESTRFVQTNVNEVTLQLEGRLQSTRVI